VSRRIPMVTVSRRIPMVTVSRRIPMVTVSRPIPMVTVSRQIPMVTVSRPIPMVTVSRRIPMVTVSHQVLIPFSFSVHDWHKAALAQCAMIGGMHFAVMLTLLSRYALFMHKRFSGQLVTAV
jgi:hypothetical protein